MFGQALNPFGQIAQRN